MAFKTFFQIKEANAEIARLSSELTTAQQALEALKQTHAAELLSRDEAHATALTEVRNERAALVEADVRLKAELATAQASITAKDAEIAGLKGKATTVEQRAAELASTVGGSKPIAADPAGTGAGTQITLKDAWSKPFLKR